METQTSTNLADSIGKIFSALADQSKLFDGLKKKYFEQYKNEVKRKMSELRDANKICYYLLDEIRECKLKFIEAKIQGDGFNKNYYTTVIDELLEPLFDTVDRERKYKMDNPLPKPNVDYVNLTPVPVVKEIPSQKEEKIIPFKIINPAPIHVFKKPAAQKVVIASKLPEGFTQIELKGATKQETEYFFSILSKEKNPDNGKIYMEEKYVREFLEKNFTMFGVKPSGGYSPINLEAGQKKILSYFIYQFYKKYEKRVLTKKDLFAKLLIFNFKDFTEENPLMLGKNLGKIPKRNRIPVEKYFD